MFSSLKTLVAYESFVNFFCNSFSGSAIKCFVCNSHKDANCALDMPPDNLLKDCQEDYSSRGRGISTYCRKITQIIEFSVNNCKYMENSI